jgi:predicted transport protein
MPIFKDTTGALKKLNTLPLDKERNLQKLVEDNLMEVLELHFLATEYVTTFGGRIDTLAVDANGAPVIIEYKRNKNDNVINQALSYLKWLRAQKPEFFQMLMINKLGQGVAESIKLDWNNPRVICIAESYSKFDVDTVEVVPLRIELFKYRYYEQGIFGLESLNVPEAVSAATPASTSPIADKPASSVALLREKGSPAIRELFGQLQEQIVNLDEGIEEKPTSLYVAYRAAKNFAEVHIGRNQLKIHLRPIDYVDPRKRVDKIPDGYNWTMDRRVYLDSADDLDYVVGLIEQSYKNVL